MKKMKCRGAIFDFNGTLFFDSDKHEMAWNRFSSDIRGYSFTKDEMQKQVHGHTNRSILEFLLNREIPDDVLHYFVAKKEAFYRSACLQDRENMKLASGAFELLESLKRRNIPMNIATSSEETNLAFFQKHFGLTRWFDPEKIIYDDYTIKGKPEPDMYIKAAEKLEIPPSECLVFEDSPSGIKSAQNAGVRHIIVLHPSKSLADFIEYQCVDLVIPDFTSFDTDTFF
jgi:HAD superfamily hydrolase (TIGR01509 family)